MNTLVKKLAVTSVLISSAFAASVSAKQVSLEEYLGALIVSQASFVTSKVTHEVKTNVSDSVKLFRAQKSRELEVNQVARTNKPVAQKKPLTAAE